MANACSLYEDDEFMNVVPGKDYGNVFSGLPFQQSTALLIQGSNFFTDFCCYCWGTYINERQRRLGSWSLIIEEVKEGRISSRTIHVGHQ